MKEAGREEKMTKMLFVVSVFFVLMNIPDHSVRMVTIALNRVVKKIRHLCNFRWAVN